MFQTLSIEEFCVYRLSWLDASEQLHIQYILVKQKPLDKLLLKH